MRSRWRQRGARGWSACPLSSRAETSLTHVFVQIAGNALRMRADTLKEEGTREGPFRRLLIGYQSAFLAQVSQGVACNGLHPITQRCCRWLLMTHDRVQGDSFLLTHELLAMMLGVRRASISEVLRPLQEQGLIGSRRGKIAILDRDRLEARCCECYRSVEDVFTRLLELSAEVTGPAGPTDPAGRRRIDAARACIAGQGFA